MSDAVTVGPASPAMSVVLVTDRYETIRGVVRHLAAQTVARVLELVVVVPAAEELALPAEDVAPLQGYRVVRVERIFPLALARAAGVRAAGAPVITVGETHAYPCAEWAEIVLAAFAAGETAVLPGFDIANPDGPLSWANVLIDYGLLNHRVPAGTAASIPSYHLCFTREWARALGPRLDRLFGRGFDVAGALRETGVRPRFEPAARMYHVNASRTRSWPAERFRNGRAEGAGWAERWGRPRRIATALASPLIAAMILWRRRVAIAGAVRSGELPRGTLPAILAASLLRSTGDAAGFLVGATDRMLSREEHIEVHKVRFSRRGVSGLILEVRSRF